MSRDGELSPRLRPVEAFPVEHEGEQMVLIQDPAGLAEGSLVVSPAGFFVMTFFDGRHSLEQVREGFRAQFGEDLPADRLAEMVEQLDAAHYLDSPGFEAYHDELVEAYRAAPTRVSRDAESFGADGAGLGPLLDRMLGGCAVRGGGGDRRARGTGGQAASGTEFSTGGQAASSTEPGTGGQAASGTKHRRRLVGLVAPHLDYGRGGPCYLSAYRVLAENGPIERAVILGTNHFGWGCGVVATDKPFETPLGITSTDRAFLAELEQRCGAGLCEHDFDHLREHSVELQVLILQHLFGPSNIQIVPVLCPDPCGPTGTAPCDGQGVDLRVFAEALGAMLRDGGTDTVVIAGADLSHFGRRFGDDCELDPPLLSEVERKDREVLGAIVAGRRDVFLETIKARDNDTRICSVGSLYALMTAQDGARAELLHYHQAVDRESGIAVSCSAMAMWEEDKGG